MGHLSTEFDAIFNRHRGQIPLNYVRALGYSESRLNPREASGPAWGILQVVEVVRHGYNERHGTSFTRAELLDPEVCTMIACDLLNRIQRAYDGAAKTLGPLASNMRPDWKNAEYAKLVTAGWNSGYSRGSGWPKCRSSGAGVQSVAACLKCRGVKVTHDSVFHADCGGTRHLDNDTKYRWQRGVVRRYFDEGGPGLLDAGGMGLGGYEPALIAGTATSAALAAVGYAAGVKAIAAGGVVAGVLWLFGHRRDSDDGDSNIDGGNLA